jgi:GTP cyclohydrolase I
VIAITDQVIQTSFEHLAQKVIDHYALQGDQTASEIANFAKTPKRAAKAWMSVSGAKYVRDRNSMDFDTFLNLRFNEFKDKIIPKCEVLPQLQHVLSTAFPMEPSHYSSGLVIQGPIMFDSLCPHHLLPVIACAFIGYKPKDEVLGLSKLARALKILAARPVLQEQLCRDMADVLFLDSNYPIEALAQIESEGSAVQIIGIHSCMACRGVMSDASTLSQELRGLFYDPNVKSEFYQAIDSIMHTRNILQMGRASSKK